MGELAYNSEAAQRLRAELRASARALKEAERKVDDIRQELADSAAVKQALEQEVNEVKQQLAKRDEVEARLSVRLFLFHVGTIPD